MSKAESSTISFEPKNSSELSEFFKTNKSTYHEFWIILTKKKYSTPQPVSFLEAITEAVKQGLIDSRTKTVTEEKYAVRFTKRKNKIQKLKRTLSQNYHLT